MEEAQSQGLPANRIEALSDGIFAVAMTILVLEIHVPERVAGEALSAHLWMLWPKIASYAIGFIVIGTVWVGHHIHFHYIRRVDRALLWINLLLLMSVSFLPFCVALLGSYNGDASAAALYGVVVEVAYGCLLAQWLYATKRRRLVSQTLDEGVVRALRGRVAIGMYGYGAGIASAFFAPRFSLLFYAVIPVLYIVPGRIDHHVKKDAT